MENTIILIRNYLTITHLKKSMKGSYLLVIEMKEQAKIAIGKLGELNFKPGYYIYVGSALSGLEQRIARHLRSEKKLHWHIDYLLEKSKLITVYYKKSDNKEECKIADQVASTLEATPNFGCSDCTCHSHLFYGSKNQAMKAVNSLQMQKYIY